MIKRGITKYSLLSNQCQRVTDLIALEKSIPLFIDRSHYVTFLCTPSNLKELAIGHSLTDGILKSVDEIERVTLERDNTLCRIRIKSNVDIEKRRKLLALLPRVVLSACGGQKARQFSARIPKLPFTILLEPNIVMDAVRQLNSKAEIFRLTGGVHAAAIHAADGSLQVFAEDVGRHNAVDKVIGMSAIRGIQFGNCFLVSTGRLNGDMVLKAVRTGLQVVASLAAATDSGIRLARKFRLTLIGFVRGNRMNIYNGAERVRLS